MPPTASFISNVGNVNIEGSNLTMNVRQKTIVTHDLNNFRSLLESANTKQNDDLAHAIESRMQKFSENLEDQLQRDSAHALLSRIQQLVKLLPAAHRDLALQFAGTLRPHTSTRRVGDNFVLVCGPLLSSSIFSTFSAEVQFMVIYFLVAMIIVDLFHPRLIHNRLSSRVSVLDALGKYHDFPWSACKNLTTFHAECLRRFLNQTGFSFVKSRLYEVEYNGCIMEPNDWANVKPFTDLFVDFLLIQQGRRSRIVSCPWCRSGNPFPPVSASEPSTTKCSCSDCGRDFSAAYGSFVEDGSNQRLPLGLDKSICLEIRRFRIKVTPIKQIMDLSHVPCKFFKVGGCTAGALCPFSHIVQEPGQKEVCTWFVKGNCKFGHKCAMAHIFPGQTMAMDRKNKKAAQLAASASADKNKTGGKVTNGGGAGGSKLAPTRILNSSSSGSSKSGRPPINMALKATISPSEPAPLQDTDFASFATLDLDLGPQSSDESQGGAPMDSARPTSSDSVSFSPSSSRPSTTLHTKDFGLIGSPPNYRIGQPISPIRTNGSTISPVTSPRNPSNMINPGSLSRNGPLSAPGNEYVVSSSFSRRQGIPASLGSGLAMQSGRRGFDDPWASSEIGPSSFTGLSSAHLSSSVSQNAGVNGLDHGEYDITIEYENFSGAKRNVQKGMDTAVDSEVQEALNIPEGSPISSPVIPEDGGWQTPNISPPPPTARDTSESPPDSDNIQELGDHLSIATMAEGTTKLSRTT